MVETPPATGEPAAPATGEPAAPATGGNDEAVKLLEKFKEAGLENPAGALDLIKKLRDYEKGDKLPDHVAKELADLKKRAQELEDAKLSDTQRLQKEIDELKEKDAANEARAKKSTRDTAIVAAARTAGAIDPDAMPALISTDDLEFDKAGNPTNLKELLAKLKKDKPMWFGAGGPGSFDGGSRQPTDEPVDMNTAIRQAAGR